MTEQQRIDVEAARDGTDADPVFVDASGRRTRWSRRAGRGVAGVCATYGLALGLSVIGAAPFAPDAMFPFHGQPGPGPAADENRSGQQPDKVTPPAWATGGPGTRGVVPAVWTKPDSGTPQAPENAKSPTGPTSPRAPATPTTPTTPNVPETPDSPPPGVPGTPDAPDTPTPVTQKPTIPSVLEPVTDPVVGAVGAVVKPVTETVAGVVKPVVDTVAAVVEPVTTAVKPVTEALVPVTTAVERTVPALKPITDLVTGLTDATGE
ncbi:hypothetical protein [Streptomyces sp. NBC_01465]|uniref:hypothetical protein n=1 Tax=Streptomyces sp. NBC_01465 TaxID=2903878 RepID=UPI002E2FC11A|nr:hypothetical protein [Streptomyces sp. NBC_01465]